MRTLLTTLATLLLVCSGLLVSHTALADYIHPTRIFSSVTADTVPQNHFYVGSLHFFGTVPYLGNPFDTAQIERLEVLYGLSEWLHIGIQPLQLLSRELRLSSRISTSIPHVSTLYGAVPLDVHVDAAPVSVAMSTGLALRWSPASLSALHAGFRARTGKHNLVATTKVYTGLTLVVTPIVQILAEFNYWPFRSQIVDSFSLDVGFLMQKSALRLRVYSDFLYRLFTGATNVGELHVQASVQL